MIYTNIKGRVTTYHKTWTVYLSKLFATISATYLYKVAIDANDSKFTYLR